MAKVDIESVKPNSHKYKEEQKQEAKKEKVISAETVHTISSALECGKSMLNFITII